VRATHIELLESHSNIFETIGTYGPKDIAPNISMPVKGNASSMIYHHPGNQSYNVTKPEACFSTDAQAEAAGYHAAKR